MSSRIIATGLRWLPTDTPSVTVSVGASAWVPSAWVEVIAVMPEDGYLATVAVINQGDIRLESQLEGVYWNEIYVEVASGSAGAEHVIYAQRRLDHRARSSGFDFVLALPVGLRISANARVSVRISSDRQIAHTFGVTCGYHLTDPLLTQITEREQHCLPLAGSPLIVTWPAGGWVWGPWFEISADLSGNVLITEFGATDSSSNLQYQLGVGPAGSEVIKSHHAIHTSIYGTTGETQQLPIFLPRGRVCVRACASNYDNVYGIHATLSYILYSPAPAEIEFDPDQDVSGETIGLTWVEMTDKEGTLHVSSKTPLPDPSTFYGGWKEGEITEWGTIRRSLSDAKGHYEGTTFTWTVSDTARLWRSRLANAATRIFLNRPAVIRMIADAMRREWHS